MHEVQVMEQIPNSGWNGMEGNTSWMDIHRSQSFALFIVN